MSFSVSGLFSWVWPSSVRSRMTPAQMAISRAARLVVSGPGKAPASLAWLLAKAPDVVPIRTMTYRERQRLADIQSAINAIRSHLQRGDLSDELVYDAVRIRLLESAKP
jgi:hypothetical protein